VPVLLRDAILLILLGLAVRIYAAVSAAFCKSPGLAVSRLLLSAVPAFFWQWTGMIAASSLAFSFVHIIFGNWFAVGLCCLGGLLFSPTNAPALSLLACIDHALFGNFVFTIGLGQFFHHGPKP
jgi:hypothetical protein